MTFAPDGREMNVWGSPGWERVRHPADLHRIFTKWMVSVVSEESDGIIRDLVLNFQSIYLCAWKVKREPLYLSFSSHRKGCGTSIIDQLQTVSSSRLGETNTWQEEMLVIFSQQCICSSMRSSPYNSLCSVILTYVHAGGFCSGCLLSVRRFSPSAQKHHHALPSSHRAWLQIGQAELHYPNISGWEWSQMETWDCPNLFILLSVAL